jgi:hypothetical protein
MPKFIKLTSYGTESWVNVNMIQCLIRIQQVNTCIIFSGTENDSSVYDQSPEEIFQLIKELDN